MKRIVLTTLSVGLLLALICFLAIVDTTSRPDRVNGERLSKAVRVYSQETRRQGLPLPETVSVEELIARGLLKPEDVAGFKGMRVEIALGTGSPEPTPQKMLVQVRMQDGHEFALRGDGSV